MAIPDFQTIMLPLLKLVSDGEEHHGQKIIKHLVERFDLSEQHRSEFLPSGKEPVFNNRVRWAGFHLNKAQLLSKPRRGYLKITIRGLSVLKRGPAKIDLKLLKEYPEYSAFMGTSGKVSVTSPAAAAKEVNEQPQGSTEV